MQKNGVIFLYAFMSLLMLLFTIPNFLFLQENTPDSTFKPFPESHYSNIDGSLIHYREWKTDNDSVRGDVVLIHGFSGSSFSWRKNIDTLIYSGYNVVAVDVAPFGFSSKAANVNHSVTSNAQKLWKLLGTLDTGKWNLIGHSMGASIAGAMAALHPEKTNKLVFIDGVFKSLVKNNKIGLLNWLASRDAVKSLVEIIARKRYYNFDKFKELLSSAYACEPDTSDVLGYLAPFQIKGTAGAILDMAKSKETVSVNDSNIIAPLMIIWGDKDSWIPIEVGKKYMQYHSHATFSVIPGAGHCSMETHPKEFNSLLISFLNSKE